MRILFSTGSSARYMAPPQLAAEQVVCGPDWADRRIGDHILSLRTPAGAYDLAAVASRLPADQQPDAVVCLVDSSWRNLPGNLRAFRCPKVLLVADTHHLQAPLTRMLEYIAREPFDRIVLLYGRHHLDFFANGGVKNLFWFPGLTFPHEDQLVVAARQPAPRAEGIAFVGQTGICHPRRVQQLSQLCAAGLPLKVSPVSQREAPAIYGRSAVGFNASLNGDLNLRIFEILSSGAMLLTDRLAPSAGLTDFLGEGRELVTYGSPEELVERARHATNHPEETAAIGAAGARWFDANFNAAQRRAWFEKLVIDGAEAPPFAIRQATPVATRQNPALVSAYEYVQELHRNTASVVIAIGEGVPAEFAAMCRTLPRVEVLPAIPPRGARCDFVALTSAQLDTTPISPLAHVWCWDATPATKAAMIRKFAALGLAPAHPELALFARRQVDTHRNVGSIALVSLERGEYDEALRQAREEIVRNPRSTEAHLALADLGREAGDAKLWEPRVAALRQFAPNDIRFRQLLEAPVESLKGRRNRRLLAMTRSLHEQGRGADALKRAEAVLRNDPESAEAHFIAGCATAELGNFELANHHLGCATRFAPAVVEYWRELGGLLRRQDRNADALGAFLQAVVLDPDNFETQLALGEVAIAFGHGSIAVEAFEAAERLLPGHGAVPPWLAEARRLVADPALAAPRDLLLCHVEVTRLQGTGVLIQRFFPESRDFLTLRSRTLYKGAVEFGGTHFSLDLPGLTECTRAALVRRLLAPYRIRRILCVPFYASDMVHALAAHELTGAPVCTYVMDDQTLHANGVPAELAARLFAVSRARLAISPEMIEAYTAKFGTTFDFLPPIVTNRDHEMSNSWVPGQHPVTHCVMVGNIWSARQFEQLREFTRAAGLQVDWFGNANVSWLPQDKAAMARDGIHCKGFLPEQQLAREVARYPFVLIPGGMLDGTEDNEWLTRLSIPSRMVFILTKTHTPMIILGSPQTAAARLVERLGIGCSVPFNPEGAQLLLERASTAAVRDSWVVGSRRSAPGFLIPNCGDWIWRSLADGHAAPAPFDSLFRGTAALPAEDTSRVCCA